MKVLLNHNVWIIAFSILHTSLCLIPVTKNHDNCDLWAGQGKTTTTALGVVQPLDIIIISADISVIEKGCLIWFELAVPYDHKSISIEMR